MKIIHYGAINILIRLIIFTAHFIIPLHLFAAEKQIDYFSPEKINLFADHLFNSGDYSAAISEYQRYLFLNGQNIGLATYRIALSYKRKMQYTKSIQYFSKLLSDNSANNFRAAAHLQIGLAHIENQQYEQSLNFLTASINQPYNNDIQDNLKMLMGINFMKQKKWDDADKIFGEIHAEKKDLNLIAQKYQGFVHKGKNLKYKSPTLSGILSSVIPGAGKIYSNKLFDGLTSLLLSAVMGALTYNSFSEDGTDSLRGKIYGVFFIGFYSGNIYGSVVAARNYNRDIEQNLLTKMDQELPIRDY